MRIDRRALIATLALIPATCRRSEIDFRQTIEEPSPLSSTVSMANAEEVRQLEKGFYGLEVGGWRWTASSFSVALRPPLGSIQHGAQLSLHHTISQVVLDRVHTMTISSRIGSYELPRETYTTKGNHLYSVPVPGNVLVGGVVTVRFSVDHFLPAGSLESRELGLIVTKVELSRI